MSRARRIPSRKEHDYQLDTLYAQCGARGRPFVPAVGDVPRDHGTSQRPSAPAAARSSARGRTFITHLLLGTYSAHLRQLHLSTFLRVTARYFWLLAGECCGTFSVGGLGIVTARRARALLAYTG